MRLTARLRSSSKPVVCGSSRSSRVTPSGTNANGMNPVKPCVSSCNSRRAPQVIDALRHRLDVPEKHRTGAPAAHAVPGAVGVQPLVPGFLAPADAVAHTLVENLRAPRQSTKPSPASRSKGERFHQRQFENPLGKVAHLDGREALQMQIRDRAPSGCAIDRGTIRPPAWGATRRPCGLP